MRFAKSADGGCCSSDALIYPRPTASVLDGSRDWDTRAKASKVSGAASPSEPVISRIDRAVNRDRTLLRFPPPLPRRGVGSPFREFVVAARLAKRNLESLGRKKENLRSDICVLAPLGGSLTPGGGVN